jgi:hypothetical protein
MHNLLKSTWPVTTIDHILDGDTHLTKSKRLEIIQLMSSSHKRIKLEINNKKIAEYIWKLKNILLNKP